MERIQHQIKVSKNREEFYLCQKVKMYLITIIDFFGPADIGSKKTESKMSWTQRCEDELPSFKTAREIKEVVYAPWTNGGSHFLDSSLQSEISL